MESLARRRTLSMAHQYHPTRKIYDDPTMYEFGTPFKVTYPPWYDPSYWYEGVKLTLDPREQLSVVAGNTRMLLFFLRELPRVCCTKATNLLFLSMMIRPLGGS